MADERILEMLQDDIAASKKVADDLDKLYYIETFADFSIKPIIKLLISAANYLTVNLTSLHDKYKVR